MIRKYRHCCVQQGHGQKTIESRKVMKILLLRTVLKKKTEQTVLKIDFLSKKTPLICDCSAVFDIFSRLNSCFSKRCKRCLTNITPFIHNFKYLNDLPGKFSRGTIGLRKPMRRRFNKIYKSYKFLLGRPSSPGMFCSYCRTTEREFRQYEIY